MNNNLIPPLFFYTSVLLHRLDRIIYICILLLCKYNNYPLHPPPLRTNNIAAIYLGVFMNVNTFYGLTICLKLLLPRRWYTALTDQMAQ